MPLYRDLTTYNADDLARRFGVTAKHSIEKKAAANSDAFPDRERNYGYRMSLFAGARGRCRDAQRFEDDFVWQDDDYRINVKRLVRL